MRLYVVFSLALGISPCIAHSQNSPMSPIKPINVATEVGAVAERRNQVGVAVEAEISRKSKKVSVVIQDKGSFIGAKFELPSSDVLPLASALESAATKMYEGGSLAEKKIGVATLSTTEIDGQNYIRLAWNPGAFRSGYVTMDADNAEGLGRLLRRAFRISLWLDNKIQALQPGTN